MSDLVLKESKLFSNKDNSPILAIDFGERRLGLAISDSNGLIGSPLETLIRGRNSTYDQVIRDIKKIADENRAKSILIGLPQAFSESHKKIQDKIRRFAELLSNEVDIEMYYYDESFSSYEAERIIHDQNQSLSTKSGRVDKLSAALFLQKFLDETNLNKSK